MTATRQPDLPVALVTGSGRCGTTSLAKALDRSWRRDKGILIRAYHESRYRDIVTALLCSRPIDAEDLLAGLGPVIEVSPYLLFFPYRPLPNVPMVGLIRDGRLTVRSGLLDGWYYAGHRKKPHWSTLQPDVPGTRFERCCRFWAWCYERLRNWHVPVFRIEDIQRPSPERDTMCNELGIRSFISPLPTKNTDRLGKMKFELLGIKRIPTFDQWTSDERDIFQRTAGPTMDIYYPGWICP